MTEISGNPHNTGTGISGSKPNSHHLEDTDLIEKVIRGLLLDPTDLDLLKESFTLDHLNSLSLQDHRDDTTLDHQLDATVPGHPQGDIIPPLEVEVDPCHLQDGNPLKLLPLEIPGPTKQGSLGSREAVQEQLQREV